MSSLHELSFNEVSLRLKDGTLTVEAYVDALLERIASINPKVNALRYVNVEGAKRKAKELDGLKVDKKKSLPLFGLPFSAKDTMSVKGLPWSEGTLLRAVERDETSSACSDALLSAGAVCLGKANMSEYGKSYFTENVPFGRTVNPWDTSRSPGGSSGGDAAAVSSGMAPVGLCADSGGSIRVPAAFCGVFGHYPTRGIVSSSGLRAWTHTISSLFRSPGVVSSSLNDLEAALNVLIGYDDKDPNSTPFCDDISKRTRRKRFGFFSRLNGVESAIEIREHLSLAAKRFEASGFLGEELIPKQFEGCFEVFILLAGQASLIIDDILAAERGVPRDPSKESPILQSLRARVAAQLPPLTAERLLWAWSTVDRLRREALSIFENFDFVLMPVAATLAPPHGTTKYDVDGVIRESQEVFQFASSVNVLGLPSIAFPAGISISGLPIGLQVVGPRFSDRNLIQYLKEAGFSEMAGRPSI